MRKVMDYNFFRQARHLADQLKPVAVAIAKARSDTTGLAHACKIFMDLQDELLLQPHKDATWLHPGYKGRGLSTKQEESAV